MIIRHPSHSKKKRALQRIIDLGTWWDSPATETKRETGREKPGNRIGRGASEDRAEITNNGSRDRRASWQGGGSAGALLQSEV